MADGRVVLVTGASSGLGQATAALLVSKGFRVYGTSRKKVDDPRFKMLQLDVTSEGSVAGCVSNLLEEAGRLDALVNNAGYVLNGAVEETSLAEAQAQFDTNFWGVVRMNSAVLPLFRRQRAGQIVTVGSVSASIPMLFEGFYASTKAALVAYSDTLRHEVMDFNIRVSVVEPGFYRTNIGLSLKKTAVTIEEYKPTYRKARAWTIKQVARAQDPGEVARTVLKILQTRRPELRYTVGREARLVSLRRRESQRSFDSRIRRIWGFDEPVA